MTDVDDRCPRCGGPTRIYYDERDEWAVCLSCRVGWWIGSGYPLPPDGAGPQEVELWYADTESPRPPAGAIYLDKAMPFWTEIPAPGSGDAPPAASEGGPAIPSALPDSPPPPPPPGRSAPPEGR